MEDNLDLLKKYWQNNEFRPLQKEIIEHYQSGKDTVVLLPTGGGKSICYQLPSVTQEGLTLVISPLVSIMHDQVNKLNERGIKAMYFENNTLKNSINQQFDNAKYGNFIEYLKSEFDEKNLETVLELLEKYEIEDIKLLRESQNLAFIKQNISSGKKLSDDLIRKILDEEIRKQDESTMRRFTGEGSQEPSVEEPSVDTTGGSKRRKTKRKSTKKKTKKRKSTKKKTKRKFSKRKSKKY